MHTGVADEWPVGWCVGLDFVAGVEEVDIGVGG